MNKQKILADTLSRLIRFQTISADQKTNKKALAWVKKELQGYPLYFTDFNQNGFHSLIITTKRTKKPVIWLNAHMDVVPGEKRLFKPTIKANKLYGRGASDMKFAIACFILLLKELGDDLSKYNFGIILVSDEEVGGFNGTKAILAKGYSSQLALVPDVGNKWETAEKVKGLWRLRIQSFGKTAHASRPWLGDNAVVKLSNFLSLIEKQFVSEPCGDKQHWHKTLNIGKISGGTVLNQIPDYAEAGLDIRFTSPQEITQLKQYLKELTKKFKNKIKIEELIYKSGFTLDQNNRHLKIFSKIAKDKFNIKTKPTVVHGTFDGSFFAAKGIPVIGTKPQGGDIHGDNEWIDLADLEKFYEVLKEFVKQVTIIKK